MSAFQHKRLPKVVIEADRAALLALKKMTDYAPSNPTLNTTAIIELDEKLRAAEETEILAAQALAAARDAHDAAGWEFHNAILGVKATVSGQYGNDSDAVQALGLKKKSDYQRPVRQRKTPPT